MLQNFCSYSKKGLYLEFVRLHKISLKKGGGICFVGIVFVLFDIFIIVIFLKKTPHI